MAICGFAICRPNIFSNLQILRSADPNLLRTCNFRKSANSSLFCLQIFLSVLWWKICGFAVCVLAHQQNLQICNLRINQKKFADSYISENLRICNCRLRPRICRFKKIVVRPPLQICHQCQQYQWQIATIISDTSSKPEVKNLVALSL